MKSNGIRSIFIVMPFYKFDHAGNNGFQTFTACRKINNIFHFYFFVIYPFSALRHYSFSPLIVITDWVDCRQMREWNEMTQIESHHTLSTPLLQCLSISIFFSPFTLFVFNYNLIRHFTRINESTLSSTQISWFSF